MINIEQNKYCVYEHIRKDTNQCFYVGKGTLKRAYNQIRNKHHNRIVKKCGSYTRIIRDGLTEQEAYDLEREVISNYVFNLGYGIDIIGYNNVKNENGHLTNHTFGGDGSFGLVHSDKWRKHHSERMMGENNPAYNVNYWETFSEEKANDIRKNLSKKFSGTNNPMYGISPKERMDKETYEKWIEKRSINSKGSKNPNYGNDVLKKKLSENPELKNKYYSRPNGQNGRAKKVELYDVNYNYISSFDCMSECAKYLKDKHNIKTNINTMITAIKNAALNNKVYKEYRYKI